MPGSAPMFFLVLIAALTHPALAQNANEWVIAESRALFPNPPQAIATKGPSRTLAGLVAPLSCGIAQSETRWLADSYRETHRYGLDGEEEWIGSYGGLATAGDSLFLWDQLRPRVVHLSGELEERSAFGRKGEGPGEFDWAVPVAWIDDIAEGHVAFDGHNLVVYDRNDVAFFDGGGTFRWLARMSMRNVFVGGVTFVTPVDADAVILGVDSLDAGSRHLQLWRVRRAEPDRHELLWERTVFRRAGGGGRFDLHRREARPYWARHGDCILVSDGGSRFVQVVELSTLRTDSVALPEWEVPDFGDLPSDFSVMNFGGRETERPPEPALLRRWRGLIVDPDGHLWVRAWTDSREDFEVFVVSLASGESHRLIDPPGFPTAFGPPGVFYMARETAELGEQYLVRLQGAATR